MNIDGWIAGPDFGTFLDTTEPIFERLNRFSLDPTKGGRTSAVCDYFNPRAGYGAKATTAVKCMNDEDVTKAVCENVEAHEFVFGRLMELANTQGCTYSFENGTCTEMSQGTITTPRQSSRFLFRSRIQ